MKTTKTITALQLAVLDALSGPKAALTSTIAAKANIATNRARGRLHRLWEQGYVDAAFDETGESLWTLTAKAGSVLTKAKRAKSGRRRKVA